MFFVFKAIGYFTQKNHVLFKEPVKYYGSFSLCFLQ
jgi:hypothetical protein